MPASVRVTSPALSDGGRLPTRFTCDGTGVTPPLALGGPANPVAWAVVVDDPDAAVQPPTSSADAACAVHA